MAAFGVAGANAALSPLLSSFGSSMLLNSLLSGAGNGPSTAAAALTPPFGIDNPSFLTRYSLMASEAEVPGFSTSGVKPEDQDSKTSSIADLRLKAKKHQEALGLKQDTDS